MKPILHGWKEGVIKKDLTSFGGTKHRKGSIVRYKKYKRRKSFGYKTSANEYEWHYIDQDNYNLIRSCEFLIEE